MLEEQIAGIIEQTMGKNICQSDIDEFNGFEQSVIQDVISNKQLLLTHLLLEYDLLGRALNKEPSIDAERILNKLLEQLEIAKQEFEISKKEKMIAILRDMRIALSISRSDLITGFLLDLQTLKAQTKDAKVVFLENQLKTLSEAGGDAGLLYLDYTYRIDKREELLERILTVKSEVVSLNNLIN